jgi:hypothetical protein
MSDLAWVEIDRDSWGADLGGIGLMVSRRPDTGEWSFAVTFPDGREVTARHPYLTRGTAQAAAERAAAEQ